MPRIALSYARISGPTDERTASLESQEEAIVAKLESLGYTVPPEFRFRERWSGVESIYERQVLIRCRELIASGQALAFGVFDTDRLARDPRQLDAVVADVVLRGAEVVFARLDVDPSTRIGQLILQVKGFASITEIDSLKDRTSRGRQKKYEAGLHAGYGRCRFGYRRDRGTGERSIDPATAPVVARIFEALAAGTPPAALCRQLDDDGILTPFGRPRWTTSGLRVIVREATYYGHCVGRRTMSTGIKRANGTVRQVPRPEDQRVVLDRAGFPPLVSRDLWEAANAALASAARGPRPRAGRTSSLFLLAGLVRCGCGFRMTQEMRKHRTGKSRCYRCTGGSRTRANRNGCRRSRGAAKLEEHAWARVLAFVLSDDAIERECRRLAHDDGEATMRRDLATAEARRKKVDRRAARLLEASLQAAGSRVMKGAVAAKQRELDAEADRLDALIADLRRRLIPYATLADTAADFERRVKAIRRHIAGCSSLDDRRAVLVGLGVSVTVHDDHVRIDVDPRYACGSTQSIACNISGLPTSIVIA